MPGLKDILDKRREEAALEAAFSTVTPVRKGPRGLEGKMEIKRLHKKMVAAAKSILEQGTGKFLAGSTGLARAIDAAEKSLRVGGGVMAPAVLERLDKHMKTVDAQRLESGRKALEAERDTRRYRETQIAQREAASAARMKEIGERTREQAIRRVESQADELNREGLPKQRERYGGTRGRGLKDRVATIEGRLGTQEYGIAGRAGRVLGKAKGALRLGAAIPVVGEVLAGVAIASAVGDALGQQTRNREAVAGMLGAALDASEVDRALDREMYQNRMLRNLEGVRKMVDREKNRMVVTNRPELDRLLMESKNELAQISVQSQPSPTEMVSSLLTS